MSEEEIPRATRRRRPKETSTESAEEIIDNAERPRKKAKGKLTPEERVTSYAFGVLFALLGVGLLVGYYFTQRAPSKLFNLLAAGGIASLISGIGLFIYPLDEERMHAFRNERNPIEVFGVMPVFWKLWMLLILAAMIGAFVYVAQNTVRVN